MVKVVLKCLYIIKIYLTVDKNYIKYRNNKNRNNLYKG